MIISDTHDNMHIIKKLLSIASQIDPDMIIHCGDYISPFAVKAFKESNIRMIGVWGNNDGDKPTILRIIKESRIDISPQPLETKIGGIDILVVHGWGSIEKTKRLIYSLAKQGTYKIIIYGHIHSPDIKIAKGEKVEDIHKLNKTFETKIDEFKTMILNPGEACGYVTGKSTYMLMEIDNQSIKVSLKEIQA